MNNHQVNQEDKPPRYHTYAEVDEALAKRPHLDLDTYDEKETWY